MTVIEFGARLISREDDDVSQAIAAFLKEEGIDVRVDSKMTGVEKQGDAIVAKVEIGRETFTDYRKSSAGCDRPATEH